MSSSRHNSISNSKKYRKMSSSPLPISLSDKDRDKRKSNTPKFKVIFLGDQSVGKTSIISKYVYDKFDVNYKVNYNISFLFIIHNKIII